MRIILLLLFCFCSCNQQQETKSEFSSPNRYLIQLKDSVLVQTIREYINTFHLHPDSMMVKVYETSCWESHKLIYEIDYNKSEDLIIRPGDLPAYYTFIDSMLVTIYNNSYAYVDSSTIEHEIKNIVKSRSIHLKKTDDNIFDPPLWTVSILNDSVTVTRRNRR